MSRDGRRQRGGDLELDGDTALHVRRPPAHEHRRLRAALEPGREVAGDGDRVEVTGEHHALGAAERRAGEHGVAVAQDLQVRQPAQRRLDGVRERALAPAHRLEVADRPGQLHDIRGEVELDVERRLGRAALMPGAYEGDGRRAGAGSPGCTRPASPAGPSGAGRAGRTGRRREQRCLSNTCSNLAHGEGRRKPLSARPMRGQPVGWGHDGRRPRVHSGRDDRHPDRLGVRPRHGHRGRPDARHLVPRARARGAPRGRRPARRAGRAVRARGHGPAARRRTVGRPHGDRPRRAAVRRVRRLPAAAPALAPTGPPARLRPDRASSACSRTWCGPTAGRAPSEDFERTRLRLLAGRGGPACRCSASTSSRG